MVKVLFRTEHYSSLNGKQRYHSLNWMRIRYLGRESKRAKNCILIAQRETWIVPYSEIIKPS